MNSVVSLISFLCCSGELSLTRWVCIYRSNPQVRRESRVFFLQFPRLPITWLKSNLSRIIYVLDTAACVRLALFMRRGVTTWISKSSSGWRADVDVVSVLSRMGKRVVNKREREREIRRAAGGKKSPTSSYRWLWIRQKRVECLTRTIHRWRVTVANDRQPFSFIPGDTSKLGVVRRRLPSREAAICCCKKAASRFYFGMLAHRPTHGFSNVAITASCKTATRAQLYGLITRNWN